MIHYRIALIDRRRNFRKFFDVNADTALDAIKHAKAKDPNFQEVESCTLVEFLG